MYFLISPSKALDFQETAEPVSLSTPTFLPQAQELINLLKPQSVEQIAHLMGLSERLAQLNVDRYQAWRLTPLNESEKLSDSSSVRAAILAFNGDVYEGLAAHSLSTHDLDWAQQHVAILSGLYGLLRPLDRLQAYRLEMGAALANSRGKNLYHFWGEILAKQLNQWVAATPTPVLVNLASQEYFKAVNMPALMPAVIDCVFEDWKNSAYKIISFFAKRARGLMLRYAIEQRIVHPEQLQNFEAEGYALDASASELPYRLVFRRRRI
jgi:uncharacterized protein